MVLMIIITFLNILSNPVIEFFYYKKHVTRIPKLLNIKSLKPMGYYCY